MSENNQTEVQQHFQIQKIYTKNISFESPKTPEVFLQEFQPKLDVDLNVETDVLEEGTYHVLIRVTATTMIEDATAFLCEVEQAGIFTLEGFNEQEIQYLLASQCPAALFPYARETISSLVAKGGFPQLVLEPVNFDAMFASHLEQEAQGTQQ
ncbi:protein-export chaperone SecB [Hydrogenovibrio sp. JE_KL2]|jgi:preprotein translocase subunit SecB|uniref:protein-export chaperone SecB n=1 Tax=Hydrogenovibrio sp. JE_KL2 TaxID=2651188 RepID=UPI00128E8D0A|nr:protein-export chaperone SecB [Hydrogenovibrio sp. JE_KL2]MPQ76271.1 protein-export chaperone SecB [Hydrogenovibrio sp. JE_KL2]